jgi:hypothetical protein
MTWDTSNPYASKPRAKLKTKSKSSSHPNIATQVLGNLKNDIVDTATGMPAGLLHSVEHPIDAAQQIGQSYADLYGPLLHGDFGKFGHNVAQHPLSPALDLLSLVSLGAGTAARAAGTVGRTAEIGVAKAGAKGLEVGVSPGAKGLRQVASIKATEKLPENIPLVGMRAKGIRTAANDQKAFEASLRAPERDYWKVIKKHGIDKDPAMQTALDSVIRGINPKWLSYICFKVIWEQSSIGLPMAAELMLGLTGS